MEFQSIATGYYLEALGVAEDAVWFSDVVTGGVRRLSKDGRIDEWLPGKRWIGSILLNDDGCVFSSGAGGIAWVNPTTGASGMLLESIGGEPMDGVNEITSDGMGGIYFGTLDVPAIERGQATKPVELYRLNSDGRVTRLCEGLRFSNGIGVSSDGRKLYHNESFVGTFAYDLASDGNLGRPTLLVKKPDCDGMAIDCEGGIWITGFRSREILRVFPDGTIAARIPVPGEAATNIRFGGADGRDLYVTTVSLASAAGLEKGILPDSPDSVLYRARSEVAGQQLAKPRFRLGSAEAPR